MVRVFGLVAVFCLIVAFILFVTNIRNKDKTYRIFTLYLGLISICEISLNISFFFVKNNLIIGNIDSIVQFVLLSLFFSSMYQDKLQRNLLVFLSSITLFIILAQFIQDPSLLFKYGEFSTFSTSFLLIIYGVTHLYNLLNAPSKFYYATIGLLTYLLGSTIVQLTGNIFVKLMDVGTYKQIWVINNLAYLTFQLFVIVEWYKNYRPKNVSA